MESELLSRDLPTSIMLPQTKIPQADCMHINTFKNLSIDLQREYAIHYELPDAQNLTAYEICSLLRKNEWIPALKHHVWIPSHNLNGVTVSHDIRDLEIWRDTQLIFQAMEKGTSSLSASQIYEDLRARWEHARHEVEVDGDIPRDQQESDKEGVVIAQRQEGSMQGPPQVLPARRPQNEVAAVVHSRVQVGPLSPAQLHLAEAREQITKSDTYYQRRREPIVVDGDVFGDIIRLEDNRINRGDQQRYGQAQQVQPSPSASKAERSRVTSASPNTQVGCRNDPAKGNAAQARNGSNGRPSTPKISRKSSNLLRKSLSKSISKATSTSRPRATSSRNVARAQRVIEGGVQSSNPMPSFTAALQSQAPQFTGSSSNEPSRFQNSTADSNIDETVQNVESESGRASPVSSAVPSNDEPVQSRRASSVSSAAPSIANPEIVKDDVPRAFEPSLSAEMVYLACVLRGKPLERQYAMLDVLEGERGAGDLSAFIEAFQSMIADASQAVVGHTRSLISGLQSLFGFARSPLKRTREDDDVEQSLSQAQAELEPVTPRKRARRGDGPNDAAPRSIIPGEQSTPSSNGGVPSNEDSEIRDVDRSGTDKKEPIPRPRTAVDRLSGVLRKSGTKNRTQAHAQDGPATPRRSARIANASPRRSPRNSAKLVKNSD